MFVLDKVIPNLIKHCPIASSLSRHVAKILTNPLADKIDDIRSLIYDLHREVCKQANMNLFIDNMPDRADDCDITPETVFNTLEPAHIQGVVQLSPSFYAVFCPKDIAISLHRRINNMMVGDNLITTSVSAI